MKPRLSMLAAALPFVFTAPLKAQSVASMEPVVVTATRVEQSLSEVIPSVTVISREDIERSQAVAFEDLLVGQPGVEISRYGGLGAQPAFFLRGQDSNSLAIYVDGVRIQTDGYGSLQTGALPSPQLIDHIEILRGNASSLYGEAVTGGVIDIHTKAGNGGEPKFYATATMGSQNTIDASAGVGGRVGDTKFNANFSSMNTDGIAPINAAQALAGPYGGYVANPNAGGSQARSANASVSHDFGRGLEMGVQESYSYSNYQYDDMSGPTNYSLNTYNQNNLTLFSKYRISSEWSTQLDLINSTFSYQNSESLSPSSNYTNTSDTDIVKWSNIYKIDPQKTLNFGLDYASQSFNDGATPAYQGLPGTILETRSSSAAYVGFGQRWNAWEFQANIRHDDLRVNQAVTANAAQDFSVNTGLLGFGYWLNDKFKLTAASSTGFRAPAVLELFGQYGNTSLLPQTTYSNEAGIEFFESWGNVRAVRFSSRTINYITYNPDTYISENVALVNNQGWELSSQYSQDGLRVVAAYTFQDPIDQNGAQLALRAKNFGSIDVSKAFGPNNKYDVGVKVIDSGSRTDGSNPNLAPYQLWSIYAGMQFNDEFKLRLRVDNASNENYQLVYGYNTPGTTAWLTLIYQQK